MKVISTNLYKTFDGLWHCGTFGNSWATSTMLVCGDNKRIGTIENLGILHNLRSVTCLMCLCNAINIDKR
jgi:hypothetical protein